MHMAKAMILMGNGYEEVEALTVVDYLRRANIDIDMVSITGSLETVGDHGIQVKADRRLEDIDAGEYDAVITPGGMPGTRMLAGDERVLKLVKDFFERGKWVASICASPMVLEAAGVAGSVKGTCYPGIEQNVTFKSHSEDLVVQDGNVITSRGPATADYFAFKLIEALAGREKAEEIRAKTLARMVEASFR
jgi:4-methyl-5(b-hydroxyethyl)-thiazole monophosphate biosynthesis